MDGPPDDEHPIRRLSSEVVYESPYLRMREDRIRRLDGSEGIYSYVEKPDYAVVIPIENDGLHLVEQYRYPIRARSWEFPQGSFPPGKTGDPEHLAREELRQETGLTATDMRHLGRLHSAKGMSSQVFDVFVATGLEPGPNELEVEEQDLLHRWFGRAGFEAMIRSGEITDAATLAAYTLYMLSKQ